MNFSFGGKSVKLNDFGLLDIQDGASVSFVDIDAVSVPAETPATGNNGYWRASQDDWLAQNNPVREDSRQ